MRLSLKKHGIRKDSPGGLPDVIMIHGTGAHAGLWQDEVDLVVDRGYRCFVPDLRGHGDTQEPGDPMGLDQYIADVMESLEQSEVKYPAIWVGHSLGAVMAVSLAERRPELFQHILAVSMPGKLLPPVGGMFEFILKAPYENLRDTVLHRSLSRRQKILVETPRHSLQQIVRTLGTVDFTQKPLAVKCPVHFCVGRLDLLAPYFFVERMHSQLKNSTLKIFEWAGHCVMDDASQQYREWFLDKVMNGSQLPSPASTS